MITTTLQELPTVFKENGTSGVATWIVKYQNFCKKQLLRMRRRGIQQVL